MWKNIGLLGTMCVALTMFHPAQASAEDYNHQGRHWYSKNHDRDRKRDYYSNHFRDEGRKHRDREKQERRREHEWRDRFRWSQPYDRSYYAPE
jgi:hypothetical protein